jgi:glycosyltransferase involved in cell wall biosynthesis
VRRIRAWNGEPGELFVALHAEKSHPSIRHFHEFRPEVPIVVAGTGTDLYGAQAYSAAALESLGIARSIVVLQALALDSLPSDLRRKGRVLYQSTPPCPVPPRKVGDAFQVCVLAHLRSIKDPLLAARAARRLPSRSQLRVVLAGALLEQELAPQLERERALNPRFQYRGALPRRAALELLAASHLCASTSHAEGGANVVTEALALDVPVVATRIPGSVGLLGDRHPGLFPVGDEAALAELLWRSEERASAPPAPGQGSFLDTLRSAGRERAWIADPSLELAQWRELLAELGFDRGPR